ncbi:selenium metabolism-associated LysR family transcriptional regulator [Alkalihalobacillus deserti]|uniref:selenium metabolism-associated LysR family transcriptional regulator n=1 Tax=Alkalihalobacillus deserti TaxID=2879466 RepID=UPI001D13491B|nr:selenium metabolism-associated LysR family transcriptional regulator [Alkalihalobacillus deserti]
MNLKRIHTFILLIDHKSFSTVGDILNISQPGVTKQIQTLEKELGTSLLYRDSLEPTDAGRLVYRKGKSLLYDWQKLEEKCRAFENHLTGLLKVGASSIPSTYIVPTILKQFLNQHPQIEINLSVYESDEVLDMVQNEKLDIGFIGSKPQTEGLKSTLIARDRLLLIGPPDSEEIKGFEDIKDFPFIFRTARSGTWKAAQKGMLEWGGSINELKCLATVHSTESVITMVESGLGYSIVSDIAARSASKYNRIKILTELPVSREFYCVYSPYKQHHPAIIEFLEQLNKKNEFL